MEELALVQACWSQVEAALCKIWLRQFDTPVIFLEKFQELVQLLNSMTTNGLVPDDDLISKLWIAASDDQDFHGMVNVQQSIVTATNPIAAKQYDDMYAVYVKAAQETVIEREANPASSTARSVNATRSFRSQNSISRSDVASNSYIIWMVNYS